MSDQAEPTEEDVAAIVAVLVQQRQAVDPVAVIRHSPWKMAGRQEAVDKWSQPHRVSRITKE